MESYTYTASSVSQKEDKGIIYRLLHQLDWLMIASVSIMVLFGLLAIYSATSRFGNPEVYYIKQLTALGFGSVIALIMLGMNYRLFKNYAWGLYIVSIIVLILVLFVGIKSKGTRAWFNLYFFSFQPVEVTKIVFILTLAAYLDKFWMQIYTLKTVFASLGIMFVHVVLILLQPDFSSCLVYFPILLGMLFVAGARLSHLAGIVLYGSITILIPLVNTYLKLQPELLKEHPGLVFLYESLHGTSWQALILVVGIIALIFFIWWLLAKMMVFIPVYIPVVIALITVSGFVSSRAFQMSIKEYQQKRLIAFVNSKIDPFGSGYNIEQSKIGIGSGKFVGKGYLSGTQTRLGFIPEQHTDFIFSVIGEELGFFWGSILLICYGVFLIRVYVIARDARDRYGSLVAAGIGCAFLFYLVINIGMVMGIMPVTGLPMPFVSYGGSSLLSAVMATGILMSIYVRRYTH